MNLQNFKKYAFAMALAIGFLVAPGLSSLSTVQAQGWGWDRGRWDDRYDRRDDRYDRRDSRYDRREEDRGYRDGLNRGREDARDHRRFDPNNSSHFRNGNSDYRAGFRRGYNQGFRQYGGYGRRY
jgi:hypothetical protein